MGKRLKYLKGRMTGITCDYPILGFEKAMEKNGVRGLYNCYPPVDWTAKVLKRAGLLRQLANLSDNLYIVPFMMASEHRLFPVCYFAETTIYAFDCWPAHYDRWESLFRRQKMKIAFISARISAERMSKRVPGLEAIWMPEGIVLDRYFTGKPLRERTIDVLELGRKYDAFHDKIRDHCAARGYDHRYEKIKGQLIFKEEADFYVGLADAKILICFPSSITHPARAGDVETMTLRYLEGIASRNVILGHCPSELHDLFGYNPCIEADMNDPAAQIDQILQDIDAYNDLVDKNLKRLHEVGTWEIRVGQILTILRERGYAC